MTFLSFVLRNIARQRVRTSLTVVGIAVGITTVVALGAVASGLRAIYGGEPIALEDVDAFTQNIARITERSKRVLEELTLQTLPDRRAHVWLARPRQPKGKVGAVLAINGHGGSGEEIVRGLSLYWYGRALIEMGYVVIAPDVGGSFGIKIHVYQDDMAACAIALALGRLAEREVDGRKEFVGSAGLHPVASLPRLRHVATMEIAIEPQHD